MTNKIDVNTRFGDLLFGAGCRSVRDTRKKTKFGLTKLQAKATAAILADSLNGLETEAKAAIEASGSYQIRLSEIYRFGGDGRAFYRSYIQPGRTRGCVTLCRQARRVTTASS